MTGAAHPPVRAAVAIGANIGDPAAQVGAALDALAQLPDTHLTARSALYRSAAMGPPQPDYCNAVCLLSTALSAHALLAACHRIEHAAGRRRTDTRWLPRELDLDVLVYGDRVFDEPGLRVPHPGVSERNFVLVPLAEIAPDLVIPGHGPVAALADGCGRDGLALWGALP